MTKICRKCEVPKCKMADFYKHPRSPDGLFAVCKTCHKERSRLSEQKYHIKETRKLYRKSVNRKEALLRYSKTEKFKETQRKYSKSHKGAQASARSRLRQKLSGYKRAYEQRLRKDPVFKLKANLRRRLNYYVNKGTKPGSAVRDLGCTINELKLHLESIFQPGMTWDNYGRTGWHIDHIKPLCSFDLTNQEEFKKANHYSNLQPLWAKDNQIKGKKYGNER